ASSARWVNMMEALTSWGSRDTRHPGTRSGRGTSAQERLKGEAFGGSGNVRGHESVILRTRREKASNVGGRVRPGRGTPLGVFWGIAWIRRDGGAQGARGPAGRAPGGPAAANAVHALDPMRTGVC